ncbi:MAG: hypothetical protein ISR51_05500 [Rhodospirillales bacterium]|nr:hypothetical protein [Alphaproteobacteria bacterium]MBL6948113.1 hypothetical protein [Rhodospirillales bacterium]
MAVPFRIFLTVLALGFSLGLTACETPVRTQKLPELTFAHLAPIKLDVAKIEVVSQYRPSLKPPDVEHLFPTPPARALRQWAKDRLRAAGRSGTARLVIVQASAVESKLPQKTGFTATFTKQQSQRYDLTLEARLEITSRIGRGAASAQATRFTTVREDISLLERERIWFDQTETLVRDFDAVMEKNMRQFLARWFK